LLDDQQVEQILRIRRFRQGSAALRELLVARGLL